MCFKDECDFCSCPIDILHESQIYQKLHNTPNKV